MTRLIRTVILGLALVSLAASAADARPREHAHRKAPHRGAAHFWRPHTVPSSSIRVHDGDTFYTGAETIRLRGIDTPELGRPRSREAASRLIALVHEGPVTIVPRAEDIYGRTVADVFVRGYNVAEILRREGFEKPAAR
ncbi:MAG: thermonuclease family protein [Candidatus Rokuibacteriota bacterium]